MALLEVPDEHLKSLRETLCLAQSALAHYTGVRDEYVAGHSKRIGAVINQIDIHRPLGSNGKHGNLHTETCGCDKG